LWALRVRGGPISGEIGYEGEGSGSGRSAQFTRGGPISGEIGYVEGKRCVLRGLTTNNSNDTNEENDQPKGLATRDTRGHKKSSGIHAEGMEGGCLGILLWAFALLVAE